MAEDSLSAEASLALLRENASRLVALTGGEPAERLHVAAQPDEWSANDVLAHIRACCDVWGGNIARILADESPSIAGMSPRTWMARTDYPELAFEDSLRAFSEQRRDLLGVLDGLMPDEWERSATVTSYGRANERTLRSYASKLATHERTHVRQIERTLTATDV